MIDLREAPGVQHHLPGALAGELVRLPVDGHEVVWITDHEPRLRPGFVEIGGSGDLRPRSTAVT